MASAPFEFGEIEDRAALHPLRPVDPDTIHIRVSAHSVLVGKGRGRGVIVITLTPDDLAD